MPSWALRERDILPLCEVGLEASKRSENRGEPKSAMPVLRPGDTLQPGPVRRTCPDERFGKCDFWFQGVSAGFPTVHWGHLTRCGCLPEWFKKVWIKVDHAGELVLPK
jgi:hypothetical protein